MGTRALERNGGRERLLVTTAAAGERERRPERLEPEMPGLNTPYCCLLLLTVLAIALPALGNVVVRRQSEDSATTSPDAGDKVTPTPGDCKEVKYPCTRVYSVQKPVKQCISYLCVTSVRRVYMVNKEICTKIMCKEDEIIQEEKCRQLAGLPPRRFPDPQDPAEAEDEADEN